MIAGGGGAGVATTEAKEYTLQAELKLNAKLPR
jgi:hypothetical protein